MNSSLYSFAWYRFRRTLRRRWRGYLAVALLIGLVGGLAMGAIAGARRTQSAFPTALATTKASDLQFSAYIGGCTPITTCLYSSELTNQIARLPHVRRVAGNVQMFLAPTTSSGKPYLPFALQNNEVVTVGSVNGQDFSQDRVIADQGRVPDPASTDEFAVTAATARILRWHVGQVISFSAFSFVQLQESSSGLPDTPPVVKTKAKLVGIVALNSSVVHDEVDQFPTEILFTPALAERVIKAGGAGFTQYSLRLAARASDVSAVERELINFFPPGTFYTFHVTSVVEGQVERATKPQSIALGAFGLIAALAALLIAGQAMSRTMRLNRQDLEIQRALGATPAMNMADSVLGMLGAIVLGATVAAIVCVTISPFSPIGTVRQVDPSPGFNFDWTVIGAGVGFIVVVLGALALALALLLVRHARPEENVRLSQGSPRIVNGAGRLGLPASSIAGIRFAVERGRGRDSVPVGSALIGSVLAVTVLVTTLIFGSSLSTLVSHPALYGWNWSYAIQEAGGGNVPAFTTRALSRDQDVARWTGMNFGEAQIEGQTIPILISEANAALSPPILSGHGLRADNQIVLGGATLAQLHKHVGDDVVVSYGTPQSAPAYLPPTRLRVVGTATMPAIGSPQALHPSLGVGALVSAGIAPAALSAATANPIPQLSGPSIVLVKLKNGVGLATGGRSLQKIADATTAYFDGVPGSGGGTFTLLPVQQPAEIVNYRTMGATPAILATGLGVGAVVALGLTLVASVRRRRRDLALLKTLGFVKRQVAAAVAWQASVAAVVGIVVGIPLGIMAGRGLWDLFAREISAVPQASFPVVQFVIVGAGALVLANLVAYVPGRVAANTPTGALLRSE